MGINDRLPALPTPPLHATHIFLFALTALFLLLPAITGPATKFWWLTITFPVPASSGVGSAWHLGGLGVCKVGEACVKNAQNVPDVTGQVESVLYYHFAGQSSVRSSRIKGKGMDKLTAISGGDVHRDRPSGVWADRPSGFPTDLRRVDGFSVAGRWAAGGDIGNDGRPDRSFSDLEERVDREPRDRAELLAVSTSPPSQRGQGRGQELKQGLRSVMGACTSVMWALAVYRVRQVKYDGTARAYEAEREARREKDRRAREAQRERAAQNRPKTGLRGLWPW